MSPKAAIPGLTREKRSFYISAVAILIVVTSMLALVASIYGSKFIGGADDTEDSSAPKHTSFTQGHTPFVWPGIRKPKTVSASQASIKKDAEIIGVSVEGRHRAYLVSAMSGMTTQVVNDLIGETPVTVTYSKRNECIAVFTADTLGKPLEVWTMGWAGELILKTDNDPFFQRTGHFTNPGKADKQPFVNLPYVRMSWHEWIKLYPDSDVFTGVE